MLIHKLKLAAMSLLLIATLAAGAGSFTRSPAGDEPPGHVPTGHVAARDPMKPRARRPAACSPWGAC